MTPRCWVLVLALALVLAAGCAPRATLSIAPEATAPMSVVQACELAQARCSRCHSTDRIVHAHVVDWQPYVRRMRLMPGSAIPPSEEPVIVRCLAFRMRSMEAP